MWKKWKIVSAFILLSIFMVACNRAKTGLIDYYSLKNETVLEELIQYKGEEVIYDGISFQLKEYLYDKETGCGYCLFTARNQDGTKLTKDYFEGDNEKCYGFELRASCSSDWDVEETKDGICFYLEFGGAQGWVENGTQDMVCLFECHNRSETLGKFLLEDCTKEKKKFKVEEVGITVTPLSIKMKKDLKEKEQMILKYEDGKKQYLVKKGKYVGLKGGTTMEGGAGTVYPLKSGCDTDKLESIIVDGKEYQAE